MKRLVLPIRRTLWRHLLIGTLGAQLAVWAVLVAVGWNTSQRETRKFTDGHLVAVAQLWLGAAAWSESIAPGNLPVPSENVHEYAQDVAILVWDNGRLVTDSHQLASALDLARLPDKGLVTLVLRDARGQARDWRAYVETYRGEGLERRVAALLDPKKRYVLAEEIAEHLVSPMFILFPLVAMMLWWTIRRGLRPLDRLSGEVAALDVFAGQRLDTQHRFHEFSSTVTAINTMVDTLQAQAGRERQFSSDVAHELRTPLAAITLQARAVQADPSPQRLLQLEQEALRAGRILTQLLELARAERVGEMSHLPAAQGAHSTVLGELAAHVIASHAQLAHELVHELSLVQPEEPVVVTAQPMLLELALRNLIENALRHTSAGTQVVVAVWQNSEGAGISVSDDGQRDGAFGSPSQASDGLGLGLRLVERIADQMDVRLECDRGEAPMTTRFSLRWPSQDKQIRQGAGVGSL